MHISELSLFHYYERAAGPFRSLTSLPEAEAQAVQASLTGFAAQRSADYLSRRRTLEAEMRILFLQAGGQPQRTAPHFLVIGGMPLSGKLVSRSRGFPPAAEFRRSIRDLLYLRRFLSPPSATGCRIAANTAAESIRCRKFFT